MMAAAMSSDQLDQPTEMESTTEVKNVENDAKCEKEEFIQNVGQNLQDEGDPYHYTKRGEFTSELYKICVENLPHYVGYQQMRKTFGKLNVVPTKLKFDPSSKLAFLTFKSEEEREAAIKAIDGYKFKKNILTAKKARPKPDPQLRKRQMQNSGGPVVKKAKIDIVEDSRPVEERLNHVVTQLHNIPYPEQLKIKRDAVIDVLKKLTKDLLYSNAGAWVAERSKQFGGICCEVENIIQSPVLNHYRNKVEYNIGPGWDKKATIVGFRLGSYKDDNFGVVEPTKCLNVSSKAKIIARIFQDFIQQSDKEYYDPGIHTGYWRQLTVRSSTSGEIMVIVQIHPQQMTEEELEEMKSSLKNLFFNEETENQITSLYFQKKGQSQSAEQDGESYEHIYGKKVIYEEMMNMKFQISPDAFFQVNTPAAELLYTKVKEWCDISETTTVLDVCCGTGTIGLSLAKAGARRVIGVEICQQAIDDAQKNAEINGITKAEFICGRAEDVLYYITRSLHRTDVVAVVDPPRAGLHKKVVQSLRRCEAIKKLIFVSCDPKQAATNFLDLCRPVTNRNKGTPYRLQRAVPVDLFPHTRHCELILLMDRPNLQTSETTKSPDQSTDTIGSEGPDIIQTLDNCLQSASVQGLEMVQTSDSCPQGTSAQGLETVKISDNSGHSSNTQGCKIAETSDNSPHSTDTQSSETIKTSDTSAQATNIHFSEIIEISDSSDNNTSLVADSSIVTAEENDP